MPHRDERPTYQGRPLPRPDEELVDQGLAFDVGTLMSRRRLLGVLGLGAAGMGLAACGASASPTAGRELDLGFVVGSGHDRLGASRDPRRDRRALPR